MMEMVKVESLEVSAVGMGTNHFGRRVDEKIRIVDIAPFDAGVNLYPRCRRYGPSRAKSSLDSHEEPPC